MSANYHAASDGPAIYIRAQGLCSMKNTPILDLFLNGARNSTITTICIDLSEVTGMDSTFMGTLVGHADHLGKAGGRLVIVRPNEKSTYLLKLLGLDEIIPVVPVAECPPATFVPLDSSPDLSPSQRTDLVRRAHVNLVNLNAANRTKFGPFLAALDADLKKRIIHQ